MENLKRKWEDLCCREADVNTELEYAEFSCGNKPRKTVQNWKKNVENLRNKVDAAVGRRGLLERVLVPYADLMGEVEELNKKGEFPQGLTLNTHHTGGLELLTKPLVGQAFQENLEKVWGYLLEREVSTIGIWGMGGVGKTTLVTHINNRALQQHNTFDVVCWVTHVPQNLNTYELQEKIAKALDVKFNEQDERKRAAELSGKLKGRRCLFILDDVWQAFDFDGVGIPVQVNGCKLIITTRSLDVCRRLDCQQKVKVEPLSEKEAWELFQNNLGNGVALSPEIQEVARECAGLPLGIVAVARSMRGVSDAGDWRDALRTLRQSKDDGLVDMEGEVFRKLKFSYSRLNDPKVQQSFLYCALYPEDYKIGRKKLVQHLIDEGLIERTGSRQAQFDKGYVILNKLVNSCLLEEAVSLTRLGEDEECVKMHDLLRDMAIKMMSPQFMVKAAILLDEVPEEKEWSKDVERVSLMHNYIKEVAGASPTCSKLSTLMLFYNKYLERIDNSFFQHMPALQILDLSYCKRIVELPDSISNLKNLISLVMYRCCSLLNMPSLAELTLLRRLDLHGTSIREVPHGLERLVNLAYLDLRARHLKVFPSGILPQLLLLEFLKFNDGVKIKGEELKMLERLSTFQGKLISEDVNGFMSYVASRRPYRSGHNCSYRFGIHGTCKYVMEEYRREDNLVNVTLQQWRICKRAKEDFNMDAEAIQTLLEDVQSLEFRKCHGAQNLCDISWLDRATHNLKRFRLWSCRRIQCLVPRYGSSPYFLQNLEKLSLEFMNNLEVLFELGRGENSIPSPSTAVGGAFSRLKVLHLLDCLKITKLFHPAFLPNLGSLQEIVVDGCHELQEIVAASDDSGGETSSSVEYSLPNLRSLSFYDLPQLKSVCAKTILCTSLCEITVADCPQLKRMPLSELPSSFRSISVYPKEWWDSTEWDHPNTKQLLQPFLQECEF